MRIALALGFLAVLTGCGDSSILSPYRNPKTSLERRVEDLFRRLTPAEKIAVVANRGVPRLGIPRLRSTVGTLGVHTGSATIHATAFPAGIAMAATWDPELVAKEGRVIAQQAQALGYQQLLAPAISDTDFEGYGEDPWVTSRMAVAYIAAVQGEGVIATPRYFRSVADRRTTEEIYFAPLRAAIEEAGAWSVAAEDNADPLLTEVLKNQWGFRGFVLPAPKEADEDSVRRALRVLFMGGIFDRLETAEKPQVDTPDHRYIARAAAVQSIVLLKNEGNLLPLDLSKVKSLALIGPNAEINRLNGGGDSAVTPEYSWKPADGIRERAAGRVKVSHAEGEREAVELAAQSDGAIVFAGADQAQLIQAVARANRNTIVVLNSGSAVAVDPWVKQVPTVLEAWYPGQEGGHAIADVLFGDANPSGKLPVTYREETLGSDGIFVGYRYADLKNLEPVFPFGHGLSFSEFAYTDLTIAPATPRYGQMVTVRVKVTNKGMRAGAEVVQLYLHDVKSSVPRPPKELKAFQRVELKPGETKLVTLTLDRRSMWFYDPLVKDWAVEPGEFEVLVGSSSRDIRLRGKFDLYE